MDVSAHISINNFSMSIAARPILKKISVDIPRKQVTAIIGPSGCGKSTLLRSMNRMIDSIDDLQIEGQIRIDDKNVFDRDVDLSDLRRRVGMIAQTPNPLPMSIYDNICYGPRIHHLHPENKLDTIVEKSLKTVGLWDEVNLRLKEPASSLSLGQQQRLCLARALAVEPEILLCDETTSALDPLSAKHIENELTSLKNEYTIVFVTHILRQAKRLADYVIFIYLGEIIEQGPAHDIFSHPRHPKTKEYLEGIFG